MKKLYWTVVTAALALGIGCDAKSTPGGGTSGKSTEHKTSGTTVISTAQGSFKLNPPGQLIAKPIKQGETRDIEIGISRKSFDQDVKLSFEGLPEGVTAEPKDPMIKHGDDNVHVKLKAADDAALGSHTVTVVGRAEKGEDAKAEMKIKITKK